MGGPWMGEQTATPEETVLAAPPQSSCAWAVGRRATAPPFRTMSMLGGWGERGGVGVGNSG